MSVLQKRSFPWLLVVLVLTGGFGPVRLNAQDTPRDVFSAWLSNQRAMMARVQSFSIEAEVDHRVNTSSGEQVARYGLSFNRDMDDPAGRGTLTYLVLDGDSLDVSERRRVERILSSMMTDDLGPLLNGLNMPTRLLSRARSVAPAQTVMEGDRRLVRFIFELDPPQRAQSPLERPGARPGMRPGVRPGAPGRRPPAGRMQPDGPTPPRPRIAVLLDAATGALVQTRVRAVLPGERTIVAETRFQRVQGLDLPMERHVYGDFPVRRRLRTVTVSLDHQTRFRVERLAFESE